MSKSRPIAVPGSRPRRIPAAHAPAEAVERIVPRRHLVLEPGDIVIVRERLPRLTKRPASAMPEWRYRVHVHPALSHGAPMFTSFAAAASHGEHLAAANRARLMFIEDDIPSMLANYRQEQRP